MRNGQFVLKNFSGEDNVNARWAGGALEFDSPRWRTMGVLVVDSVMLTGNKLRLQCTRHVATRDKSGKIVLYVQPSAVEIEVDLGDADPTTALSQLKDALFYPSIEDALASIPKALGDTVPARIDESMTEAAHRFDSTHSQCDCADTGKEGCDGNHWSTQGMTAPRYLRGRDPEFSDQARKAAFTGSVGVRLTVDNDGHPTDVWVARPLGMGLDEAAAKSVLTYTFQPALCHKTPVSVYLDVDVNFKTH
jgi:TonB family protein